MGSRCWDALDGMSVQCSGLAALGGCPLRAVTTALRHQPSFWKFLGPGPSASGFSALPAPGSGTGHSQGLRVRLSLLGDPASHVRPGTQSRSRLGAASRVFLQSWWGGPPLACLLSSHLPHHLGPFLGSLSQSHVPSLTPHQLWGCPASRREALHLSSLPSCAPLQLLSGAPGWATWSQRPSPWEMLPWSEATGLPATEADSFKEKPEICTNAPICKYRQQMSIFKISLQSHRGLGPRCVPVSRSQELTGHFQKGPVPPPQGGVRELSDPHPSHQPQAAPWPQGHCAGFSPGGRGHLLGEGCLCRPHTGPVAGAWWELRTLAWGARPQGQSSHASSTPLPGRKQGQGAATHLVPGVAPWSGRSPGGLQGRENSQPESDRPGRPRGGRAPLLTWHSKEQHCGRGDKVTR